MTDENGKKKSIAEKKMSLSIDEITEYLPDEFNQYL